MATKWKVTEDVFFLACKDLNDRRINNGCWKDGKIPESIRTIMEIYNSPDNVLVAEQVVSMMAIDFVSSIVDTLEKYFTILGVK